MRILSFQHIGEFMSNEALKIIVDLSSLCLTLLCTKTEAITKVKSAGSFQQKNL